MKSYQLAEHYRTRLSCNYYFRRFRFTLPNQSVTHTEDGFSIDAEARPKIPLLRELVANDQETWYDSPRCVDPGFEIASHGRVIAHIQ